MDAATYQRILANTPSMPVFLAIIVTPDAATAWERAALNSWLVTWQAPDV